MKHASAKVAGSVLARVPAGCRRRPPIIRTAPAIARIPAVAQDQRAPLKLPTSAAPQEVATAGTSLRSVRLAGSFSALASATLHRHKVLE